MLGRWFSEKLGPSWVFSWEQLKASLCNIFWWLHIVWILTIFTALLGACRPRQAAAVLLVLSLARVRSFFKSGLSGYLVLGPGIDVDADILMCHTGGEAHE